MSKYAWLWAGGLAALLASVYAPGCSCSGGGEAEMDASLPDAGDPDADLGDAPSGRCGNSEVEGDEDCDDGNDSEDDLCLNDCTFACGDGVVNAVEECDTAIADGEPGACPTSCDDSDACTTDTLAEAGGCSARCQHGDIASCIDGDGCCPSGCAMTTDDDCAATCGNGVIEEGETCDPVDSCPTSCDDSNACTTDTLTGDPAACTSECSNDPITACTDGDGCCPSGCDATSDDDCSVSCGNGVVEPGETCDPPSSCPTSCDDSDACTVDGSTGSAVNCNLTCTHTAVTACTDGDSCCPSGCDATNDAECSAVCGNSVIEPGETCDPSSSCPTSCDDTDSCTTDALVGDAASCTAACSFTAITACSAGDSCCPSGCDATTDGDCSASCGNGVVEPGETCDPPGSCPTSCDDSNACTADGASGTAATCDVVCMNVAITSCGAAEGCCPSGCDATSDADCSAVCGNSVIEPGETCDPPGSCPTSCDDSNECTSDSLTGSASSCTAACTNTAITSCSDGDGCCPSGCNATNDDDCSATCGNGVVEGSESCDPPSSCPTSCDDSDACTVDGSTGSAANCNLRCTNTAITACVDADGCCPSGCNNNTDSDCAPVCGNSVVESGEICDPPGSCPTSCDDSNACTTDTLFGSASTCDALCDYDPITTCTDGDGCCASGCNSTNDDDCSPVCGNGVVESGEYCDPVASCPTSCDDSDACTANNLLGSAASCTARCSYPAITSCIDADGCCPSGCNNNTDDDCAPVCGNGVTESGETCDASCPTSCDDSNACTTDVLTGSASSCDAVCTNDPITSCTDGDGCCPSGCNATTDDDCAPVCGNGVLEGSETCDPSSTCPTSCDDGMVCTRNILSGSAASCTSECSYPAITMCTDGDGCCAPGCNAVNDDDCAPVCGNGVLEPGEGCDDGNTTPGDGCDGSCVSEVVPTVFRIDNAWIRDPHFFLRPLFSCQDVTDGEVLGMPGVNMQLNQAIDMDADADGYLDLSILLIFRPLDQAGSGAQIEVALGNCTPGSPPTCDLDPMSPPEVTTYANDPSDPCIEPYAGTTSGYSPGITTPGPACFASGQVDVTLTIAGTAVDLQAADTGATYSGSPATSLLDGLMRGFISEAQAMATDVDLGLLGTRQLSDLLQPDACGSGNDQDTYMGTTGWWFYINYTAAEVNYVGP